MWIVKVIQCESNMTSKTRATDHAWLYHPPPKLFPFLGICHIIQLVGMSNMQVNLKNASNIIGLHVNDDSLF